jgi:hypothetical protein
MDLSKIHCLSINYDGIANVIQCSVEVSFPAALLSDGEIGKSDTCIAIWDTGATGSAITELTAKKLNLVPTGIKKVSGLGGTIDKNTYIVDIVLPNKLRIPNLSVTELDNPQNDKGEKIDSFGILIGMDIISMGDFSINHLEGKTTMSFRIPSMIRHDYVREWNARNMVQQKSKRR